MAYIFRRPSRPLTKRRLYVYSQPLVTINLAGVAGTGVAGAIIPSPRAALSGVAGGGVAGSLTPSAGVGIVGVAGAGIAEGIGPSVSIVVPGVAAIGQAGNIPPFAAGFIAQAAGTGTAGFLTPLSTVGIPGVSGIGAAGNLYSSEYAFFHGVYGTGIAGTINPPNPAGNPAGAAGVGIAGEVTIVVSGGGGKKRPDNAKPKLPLKLIEREITVVGEDGLPRKVPLRERFAPPPPLQVAPEWLGKSLPPELLAPLALRPPPLPDTNELEAAALETRDLQDAMEALNRIPNPVAEQVMRLLEDYRDMQDISRVLAEID